MNIHDKDARSNVPVDRTRHVLIEFSDGSWANSPDHLVISGRGAASVVHVRPIVDDEISLALP